jgi:hypothetical protein
MPQQHISRLTDGHFRNTTGSLSTSRHAKKKSCFRFAEAPSILLTGGKEVSYKQFIK